MGRQRAVTLVLVVAALALVGITPAWAATSIDQVASSLRSDPVYNDPTAENALTPGQAADLRSQIEATALPIFIAVVPESMAAAAGGPDALLRELRNAVGSNGVYAIVAGNSFRAGSTADSVTAVANDAFDSQKSNGAYAVLSAFVAGVADQFANTGSSGSGNSAASTSSSGSGVATLVVLLVILGAVGVGIFFVVRHSRRTKAKQVAAMRAVLDEDVTSLGERLGAFDLTDPRLDDAGRADLQKALDAYSTASDTAARATNDLDITRATGALEDGRFALACVDARRDGRALPQHRPPCFVDPRHGPSLDDVMWAPDGGAPHPVPVCAACEATIQAGGMPEAREVVTAGGQRVPYWRGGTSYAPYARGYYSSWGDIMPALFLGTMMAGAFSTPVASAAPALDPGTGSGGFDGGGGFGGGDFGGGGGFGGGDFGGGGADFGGGDF